jgi:hypothetical protein
MVKNEHAGSPEEGALEVLRRTSGFDIFFIFFGCPLF